MDFVKLNCEDFVEVLASKEPIPGGGGASALVGAVGIALGNMVGSLTVGKKRYADVQEDILALKAKADKLQSDLLALVAKDAEAFKPLSHAYGMSSETEEQKAKKMEVMESALKRACDVPLEIMRKCCMAIDMHHEFSQIGTAIAISDVGVGVAFCKAALLGASLNVYINTKAMKNREYANRCNNEARGMITKYAAIAEEIYDDVFVRLI